MGRVGRGGGGKEGWWTAAPALRPDVFQTPPPHTHTPTHLGNVRCCPHPCPLALSCVFGACCCEMEKTTAPHHTHTHTPHTHTHLTLTHTHTHHTPQTHLTHTSHAQDVALLYAAMCGAAQWADAGLPPHSPGLQSEEPLPVLLPSPWPRLQPQAGAAGGGKKGPLAGLRIGVYDKVGLDPECVSCVRHVPWRFAATHPHLGTKVLLLACPKQASSMPQRRQRAAFSRADTCSFLASVTPQAPKPFP